MVVGTLSYSCCLGSKMEGPIFSIAAISDENDIESRHYVDEQVDTFAPLRHLFDIMSQQQGSYM